MLESNSMLPDMKSVLSRSGPCLDSPSLLSLYLSGLEKPLLRWLLILLRFKFSPAILEHIRASSMPAAGKSALFSMAMNLFRSGSTYKTTAAGRSPLTDKAVLARARPGDLVVDAGVSDGISAAALLAALNGADIYISDRQTSYARAAFGPFSLFYSDADGSLSIKLPGFYLCTGLAGLELPEGSENISLLNPALREKYPGLALRRFDVLTGTLPAPAAIIKCANVLNPEYFTPRDIGRALKNLSGSLKEGGWIFIAQNNTAYRGGEAYIALQKTGGRLVVAEQVNDHALLPAMGGILADI